MNKVEHLTKLILTPSMSAVYYPLVMLFQALNYFFQRRWNFIAKIDKIVPCNLVMMRCMTLVEELMGSRSSLWYNVMLIHTSSRIHQARIVNGRWAIFSKNCQWLSSLFPLHQNWDTVIKQEAGVSGDCSCIC